MAYHVRREDFPEIERPWRNLLSQCANNAIFLTPEWQRTWQQQFLERRELLLLGIYSDDRLVGLAPLMRDEDRFSLLGSSDVCDYLDLIIARGHEPGAAQALFSYLDSLEWDSLNLEPLLPSSSAFRYFLPLAREREYSVELKQMDVCPEVALPPTWDEYLNQLDGKDRHELRRKMRRLFKEAQVSLSHEEAPALLDQSMKAFLELFGKSREEKARFMTPQKERFFWELSRTMAEAGYLRLLFLKLDGVQAAAVMGFDYQNSFYLYNSGYEPNYSWLSVGLLLKALCLKESIGEKKARFELLRGAEDYKYRLGGRDIPVYQSLICRKRERQNTPQPERSRDQNCHHQCA